MDLPKFLIADNTDFPENAYVVHTQHPYFILDVDSEQMKLLGDASLDDQVMQDLIEQALEFYQNELDVYEQEEQEEQE